jgi:hypothetical protein
MTTYAGANTYPNTTEFPISGQLAKAEDVQRVGQDMADRTTFLLARLSAHAESQCPLEMECLDGDVITIAPVYGVGTFDTMPRYIQTPAKTDITKLAIEGGAAPIGQTTYYLYAFFSGTPKFQLSTTAPDPWKLFKNTSTAYALIGIIQTNAGAKFVKHRQSRHFVRYLEPAQVRSPISAPTGSNVDLATRLPPEARGVKLAVNGQTNVAVISALKPFVALGPDGFDPVKFRQLLLPNNLALGRVNESVEVPMAASKKVFFSTFSVDETIEMLLQGFWW